MIDPSRTTTAPIGTSFRFTASWARSSALRMYCSSAATDPAPTPSVALVRCLFACKRRLFRRSEGELSLRIAIDHDVISLVELALEDGERERVLQQALNCPLQRTRSECRIVTFGRQDFARRGRQLERELSVSEQLLELSQLQIDDVLNLSLAKRAENDDVVDAIEKLRAEMLSEGVRHLRLDYRAVVARVLEDVGAPDVRCHDDDGVPEINGAAL